MGRGDVMAETTVAIGARVVHVPTGRVGVVVAVRRVAGGKTFVRVACDNGDVAIRPSDEWEEETR